MHKKKMIKFTNLGKTKKIRDICFSFSTENFVFSHKQRPRSMSGTGLRAEWFVPLLIILMSVLSFYAHCSNHAIFQGQKNLYSFL